MKTSKKILVVFCFFLTNYVFAQNIDSLKIRLKQATSHNAKLNLNYTIAKAENNYRLSYWNTLLTESQKQKNTALEAKILHTIGNDILFKQGKYSDGFKHINQALKKATSIKDSLEMSFCYTHIAYYYNLISQYPKALECALKALNIQEKTKAENKTIAYTLYIIGIVYSGLKQDDKALEYAKKSMHLAIKAADNKQMLTSCESIAAKFSDLKNFDSALYYIAKSHEFINVSKVEKEKLIRHYKMTGLVYTNAGILEKAKEYLLKVLALDSNKTNHSALSLFALGTISFENRNYVAAEKEYTSALQLFKKSKSNFYVYLIDTTLGYLNNKMGNYEKSIAFYKEGFLYRDSMYNDESKKKIIETEMNYEFEKKEFANKLKEEQKFNALKLENEKRNATKNLIIVIVVALLIVFFIITYVFYRNNKQKQKMKEYEKNELKQKLLLTQMNPHFIFNSLGNIKHLARGHQEEKLMTFIDTFSLLTRKVLQQSRENFISLQEEVETIENYLLVQQMLTDQTFDFDTYTPKELDKQKLFIPPMLIQPFIENAIKHGLVNPNRKGEITIRFIFENNKLYTEIIDNGKGFDNSKNEKTNHQSLAIKITKERLQYYNNKVNNSIRFENIIDATGAIVGAKVFFEIPYICEN
ncbi:MAG: histidine kinase [Bacteroidia bacterium]